MLAFTPALRSINANATGDMAHSSSLAVSLKPNDEYLVLNL